MTNSWSNHFQLVFFCGKPNFGGPPIAVYTIHLTGEILRMFYDWFYYGFYHMNPSCMTWDGCGSVLITIDFHHSLNGHRGSQIAPCMENRPSNSLKYQTPPRSKHSGAIWAHKRSASGLHLAMENPSICRWISIEKEGEHDIQICQIRCVYCILIIYVHILPEA